jgi:hypothetical protein
MSPFETQVKPKDSFSQKCIQTLKLQMVIFFEANEHFRESKGHELLCSLHSVLNEKLDFSYRLVKIKLKFSSPSKFMDPPEIYPRTPWVYVDPRMSTTGLEPNV